MTYIIIGFIKVKNQGVRDMNIWENTVLTDQGKALQAKLLEGESLKIRRVATGSKKVPVVDLRQQTSVTEGGYDITLQPARTEGDTTILPVLLENRGLKESYELWQVGFYAADPKEGEILFCIAQASQSKNIPSEAESPGFSITWDFYFNTSNTVPFEVKLESAGLVNIESYEIHTKAISNVNDRVDHLNVDLSKTAEDLKQANTRLNNKADQSSLNSTNTKLNVIGTVYRNIKDITVGSGGVDSYSGGASIAIPAGTYIVTAKGNFTSNASESTRRVQVYNNTKNAGISTSSCYGKNYISFKEVCILDLAEQNILSCRLSTGIGANLAGCGTEIAAIRIK